MAFDPQALEEIEERDIGSLRLELRARNNHLWHVIFDRWGSVAAFGREHDIPQTDVGRFLNLKASPWNKKTGELNKSAKRIVEVTGLDVLWLFDPDLYQQDFLPTQTLVAEIEPRLLLGESAGRAVAALGPAPDELLMAEEQANVSDILHDTLETLTPREEDVIRRHFGLTPYDWPQTLEAIADEHDVSRERVRQIEGTGLRKLRHPLRSIPMRRAMRGAEAAPYGGAKAELIEMFHAARLNEAEDLTTIARRSNALVAAAAGRADLRSSNALVAEGYLDAQVSEESDDACENGEAMWEVPSEASSFRQTDWPGPAMTIEPDEPPDMDDGGWPAARARIIEADKRLRQQRRSHE